MSRAQIFISYKENCLYHLSKWYKLAVFAKGITFATIRKGNTMDLQEALSEWQALQPLSKEDKLRLQRKFIVDFNYNSNHIEGNTLTYGQTEVLLIFGNSAGGIDIKETLDMKAHDVCVKMIQDSVDEGMQSLSGTFIRQLHQTMLREDYQVYHNLPGGIASTYTIHAGRYKTRPNSVITRYGDRFEYASPEETPALMSDLIDWYNEERLSRNYTPEVLAALFHYRFIRIHPFEDGNGRMARLLTNFILASNGYPMLVVRSRNKSAYLEALHKTDLQVGTTPHRGAYATHEQASIFITYFQQLLAEETHLNNLFLTEHNEGIWWFDGQRITFRSETVSKMLRIMRAQPNVTIRSLAEQTGINKSAIQKQVKRLVEKGYILKQIQENKKWHVALVSSI